MNNYSLLHNNLNKENKNIKLSIDILKDKKAFNIKLFSVNKLVNLTKYFIIASIYSQSHVKSIIMMLKKNINKNLIINLDNNWISIDFVDYIIHLFKPEYRIKYNLEKLTWIHEIDLINLE